MKFFFYYGIRASKFLTDGLSKFLPSLHIYSPSPPSPPPSNPHLQFALHLHHQPLPLVYSPPPPSTPPQVHSPPIPDFQYWWLKGLNSSQNFITCLSCLFFFCKTFFFFSMKLSFYMISDLKVCYFLIVFFFSFTKLFFLHEAFVLHDMRASNWLLPYRVFFSPRSFLSTWYESLDICYSLIDFLFNEASFSSRRFPPHNIKVSKFITLLSFFFVFHEAFFFSLFHKASFSRKSQILGTSIYCDNESAIQIVYMTSSWAYKIYWVWLSLH